MKGYKKLIAFGDEHLPTAHAARLRIMLDVIEAEKPDIIISGGDMINCDCLSDYNKTHDKLVGLEIELKQAHAWMESINKVAPKAEKILLKDNHFFRRLADKMTKEHWLSDLNAMKPENLLKLDKFGFTAQPEYNFKNVLLFMHGDGSGGSSSNPVNQARKDANKYGITVVRFHSHCTGFELHRNYHGEVGAIQLGTFEDPQKAEYIKHGGLNNWTTSFGLFYLSETAKEFFFVPAYFINDKCVLNGRLYK